MGLIKAAFGAVGSTLHDQWKEVIRCEDLGNDILMKMVTTDSNVITKDSVIVVAPGQTAVIVENGKVIDATAEEGQYTFDTSSSPSFFAGQFGPVFKEMWTRFTYGGATGKQQFVLYFNTKQIIDNKFGTPNPVPFQDWSHPIKNVVTGDIAPMAMKVKCFGKFTFQLVDPALFMTKIGGTATEYNKETLMPQIQGEVIDAFTNVLNELGTADKKVPLLELPSQTDEIRNELTARVFDQPLRERGLQITGFVIESAVPDEDSETKIKQYELGSNQFLQQGALTEAYGEAMKDAASNANGAAAGFMGLGMMNMASGNVAGAVNQGVWGQPQQPAQPAAPAAAATKVCPVCKQQVPADAKFCPYCGASME